MTAASDREAFQHTLGEIKKARLPEDYRMEVAFGKRRLLLRLSGIVEDGACTGILVIRAPRRRVRRCGRDRGLVTLCAVFVHARGRMPQRRVLR